MVFSTTTAKYAPASVICMLLAFLLGCSDVRTRSEFNPKFDFRKLRVYEWLPVAQDDTIRHIDVERVRRAVNKDLRFKGFRLATEEPDFLIAMSIGTQHRSTAVGDTSGWNRFSGGAGPQDHRRINYEEGTLKLDFIDRKTNRIFWQGEARAMLRNRPSPEKVEARITETVGKMLRDFPPKNSG